MDDMNLPLLLGTGAGGVSGVVFSSFKGTDLVSMRSGFGVFRVMIGFTGLMGLESGGETISIGRSDVEKCHDFRCVTFRRKFVELFEFELSEVFDPKRRAKSRTEPERRKAPSSSGSISAVREFFRIGSWVSAIVGVGEDRIEFIWEKNATRSRNEAFPGPTKALKFLKFNIKIEIFKI